MDASALIEQANERSELACDVFCMFDADQSGYLGFRELGQALRALFREAGLKKTPDFAALEESFGKADANGDNKVSQEEFVAWYNHAVEWTRRLQDETEAEAEAKRPARPALLGQSALSTTSTKVLFDIKMIETVTLCARGCNPMCPGALRSQDARAEQVCHAEAACRGGLLTPAAEGHAGARQPAELELEREPQGARPFHARGDRGGQGLHHALRKEQPAGPPTVRDAAG